LKLRRFGAAGVGDAWVIAGLFANGMQAFGSANQRAGEGYLPLLECVAVLTKQVVLEAQPHAAEAQAAGRDLGQLRGAASELRHEIVSDDRTHQLLHDHIDALGTDILGVQRYFHVADVKLNIVSTAIKSG